MNITFVIDAYGPTTNGTTMTAMRSAEALRERGHTVYIITGSHSDEADTFTTGYRELPFLRQISASQGMPLAKPDRTLMEKVFGRSDIVHFLLPFKMQKVGKKIADGLRVPTTAAFHVQPENITSTLRLGGLDQVNTMIYRHFRRFYNRFAHIHTPSEMIADELRKHDYRSNIHVISNGVSRRFRPVDGDKPDAFANKRLLLMIGRFSREKRQDLLIEAVRRSKHKDTIQLVLAGQGPWKKELLKRGKTLPNPPMMRFFEQDELIRLINYSDLYVHASDIEAEAISCIEAFSCGLVPLISDSPLSATKQFAIDDEHLFKAGDADDLARRIDGFLDHPDTLRMKREAYLEYAERFRLDACVTRLERMFEAAIEQFHNEM